MLPITYISCSAKVSYVGGVVFVNETKMEMIVNGIKSNMLTETKEIKKRKRKRKRNKNKIKTDY